MSQLSQRSLDAMGYNGAQALQKGNVFCPVMYLSVWSFFLFMKE